MSGISYHTPSKPAAAATTCATLNAINTVNANAAAVTPIANITANVKVNLTNQLATLIPNFPTVAKLKQLLEEDLRDRFAHLLSQVNDIAVFGTNNAATVATDVVNVAATSAVQDATIAHTTNPTSSLSLPAIRPSDIFALNKEVTKPLKSVITQDNGKSLMLAALKLK